MPGVMAVQWTLVPQFAPEPLLRCTKCGTVTAFRSSGKFRLNAQGKRLDAWLIYRCTKCDSRWNRPLFERRTVDDIDTYLLQALQSNDQVLAASWAFDVPQALPVRTTAHRHIEKQILWDGGPPWSELRIRLAVPVATATRTDRLLAAELGLSRAQVQRLEGSGRLHFQGRGKRPLRKPVENGLRIVVELSRVDDGASLVRAACAPSSPVPSSITA